MNRIDARAHLVSLVGETIWTASGRHPNRILRVGADLVNVATEKSPSGQSVPIDDVQSAFDRLVAGEEVADLGSVPGVQERFRRRRNADASRRSDGS